MYALILAALLAWTKQPEATLAPWAEAMSQVCTSEHECLMLASQAAVESRFALEVLDGRCNSREWRAAQHGWWRRSCDGGLAVGPWQIHDRALLGASPELQASYALTLMRRCPRCWTTHAAAVAQAAQYERARAARP